MTRQQALEEFLGQNVTRLHISLYKWHQLYYEVLPYSLTLKRHNWSGFVKLTDKFVMREISNKMIKKYYPQIPLD